MKFLLDTNTCVAFLTRRSAHVGERIRKVGVAEIVLCAVVTSSGSGAQDAIGWGDGTDRDEPSPAGRRGR